MRAGKPISISYNQLNQAVRHATLACRVHQLNEGWLPPRRSVDIQRGAFVMRGATGDPAVQVRVEERPTRIGMREPEGTGTDVNLHAS